MSGDKRKPGRPALPTCERLAVVPVRLTEAQKEKLQRIGAQKLRDWLDGAPDQWISVSDQAPPIGKAVLLASRSWIDGDGVFESCWHQWVHLAILREPLKKTDPVTHWMPNPSPPAIPG